MSRKAKGKEASSKQKGDLVEDVVALLHENQGVKVDKRIRLPSLKKGRRKREVDVLLTTEVTGYPVRLAIECKNEGKAIGTGRIDEFIGKLQDVGIPVSHGIYVSSTGYTSAALERALDAGIRPLTLEGLSPDRLEIAINEALQSVAYLVATWSQMSRFENTEHDHQPGGLVIRTLLAKELGFGTPAILTHLWLLWINEKIPPLMGTHHIYIRLPEEFYFEREDTPFRKGVVYATVEVGGAVASFRGRVKQVGLRHAQTAELEKLHFDAEFDAGAETIQLTPFRTEEELERFLASHPVTLQPRVKVPRIVSERTYWPPTRGALQKIQELKARGEEITFEKVEGVSLGKAWEFVIEREEEREDDGEKGA
jgi:hypothetical protein